MKSVITFNWQTNYETRTALQKKMAVIMHFENFNVYIFTIVFSALENKFHRMAIP